MKNKIRQEILEIRRDLSREYVEENSRKIMNKIMKSSEYHDAELILCYIAANNEVETRELIEDAWKQGKCVAVPRVKGKEMDFYYITSFEQLERGSFGILEPNQTCKMVENIESSCLVIVPGVAFDKNGNRIGYGAGYYDRYFEKYPEICKIAPAFSFQVVPEIKAEGHDIKVAVIQDFCL